MAREGQLSRAFLCPGPEQDCWPNVLALLPDRRQKNGPAVACRAEKFWERMPERQDLYDSHTDLVQMRNQQAKLQFLQFIT